MTHKTVFFIRIFNNLFDNNDYLFRLLHYTYPFIFANQTVMIKNSVKSLLYVKKGYFFNCKWHLKWKKNNRTKRQFKDVNNHYNNSYTLVIMKRKFLK